MFCNHLHAITNVCREMSVSEEVSNKVDEIKIIFTIINKGWAKRCIYTTCIYEDY